MPNTFRESSRREEKIMEYNPKMSLTDLFFFDGASNVQKAGQVLMAKFPL